MQRATKPGAMSNVVAIESRHFAANEAARWVARIDAGALSRTERDSLLAWLAADPRHRELLDDHARAWALSGAVRNSPRAATVDTSRRYAVGLAVAASLAAVIGTTLLHGPRPFEHGYETVVGESKAVSLPDGSRVILNTGSTLQVAFSADRRRLKLLRGEALFEVAHDASRPFEVTASGTVTRAVGTRFSVRTLSATRVALVVTEGRVEFSSRLPVASGKPATVIQAPVSVGERAFADSTTLRVTQVKRAEIERATGWASGGIAFSDERLADVLLEVNRYSSRRISVGNMRLGDLRVSGYFAIGNVDGFLSALSASAGLTMTTAGNKRTVLSRD